MDFARKQLLKYGWKEGEGLGIRNDGIKTALRPCMKKDLKGIGFDFENDQAFNWWEQQFNEAAKRVIQESTESNGISQEVPSEKDHLKKPLKRKHNLILRDFQKEGAAIICDRTKTEANEVIGISDEELFRVCGQRTVHKGARHGINFKGKLARLSKQEAITIERRKNC